MEEYIGLILFEGLDTEYVKISAYDLDEANEELNSYVDDLVEESDNKNPVMWEVVQLNSIKEI